MEFDQSKMLLRDIHGQEYQANSYLFRGTAITIGITEWDTPILSCVMTDEGEICALWIDPKFRGGEEIPSLFVKILREAYAQGRLPILSGKITGVMHPDNVKCAGFCRSRGAPMEEVERGERKSIMVNWRLEDFMREEKEEENGSRTRT